MELTITSTIALSLLMAGGLLCVIFFLVLALKSFWAFCGSDTAPKNLPNYAARHTSVRLEAN